MVCVCFPRLAAVPVSVRPMEEEVCSTLTPVRIVVVVVVVVVVVSCSDQNKRLKRELKEAAEAKAKAERQAKAEKALAGQARAMEGQVGDLKQQLEGKDRELERAVRAREVG